MTKQRASLAKIIASVIRCFRGGVCIVDRPGYFIAYGVNPDSEVHTPR